MNILDIDTTAPTIRVVLTQDGQVLVEQTWERDRDLGTKLLEVVKSLPNLKIDHIQVHEGVDHFMAVRTGIVTGQLLAQAWGVKCVQLPLTSP